MPIANVRHVLNLPERSREGGSQRGPGRKVAEGGDPGKCRTMKNREYQLLACELKGQKIANEFFASEWTN